MPHELESPVHTDWERFRALTDEEVTAAALADPDAQPLSPERLARMRRAPSPRRIRAGLNEMTQERFARLFQIPLGTLRDWEQGAHMPDAASKALLRIIERDPMAAALALNPDLSEAEIAPELGLALIGAPTT
ncbi:MAG: hypothetical protein R2853_12955 [Thermomicrobiales bacterium]|nr:hypothetical protein [Thermomicrobiales bacterium]